ncbi:hypothetical protein QNN03_08455 [Streptomyces sp. GXMU-J15]|uniref:Secreted protein n=1 Tax=Streptomyces fuscus TaxID=3048495 RepID=A0ABT7IV62_9ACTN|nr:MULTISPECIES: hypothetical protein [Streptomyces]MDL2076464.1 hypothetical protein [Streptomyces fuscus]SBT91584.1 hypothetical protein GA0115233_103215 [Streptomyces sp. DI166]
MDSGAIRRRLGTGLALLTASGLLALAAPADAHAAGTSCPGRKVRTVPFSTGSVQVYRSGGTVCAFTLAKNPGPKRTMAVSVQARGHRPVPYSGKHRRKTRTVSVYAGQRCVKVTGRVGGGKGASGWILC